MLPYFVKHYRDNFPNCEIVVCDNESTDGTDKLALELGCKVISYSTGNKLSDRAYLEIKNNWWKDAKTDWVLVADIDEFCQINQRELKDEESIGTTLIRFAGYNMVNVGNSKHPDFNTGVRAPMYDKNYLFNKKFISEINYEAGCHISHPKGNVAKSYHLYLCYHYRYISPEYLIERYKSYRHRLSDENKQRGWGSQYTLAADAIREEYSLIAKRAKPIDSNTNNLSVFVLGFDKSHWLKIPDVEHLMVVDLNGCSKRNELSEHRFFTLRPVVSKEYAGFATWRWHEKCKHLIPLIDLAKLELEPNVVWYAWGANDWYAESENRHRGIKQYLDMLIEYTGLQRGKKSFYANQFICHKDVFNDFIDKFNQWFKHFDSLNFNYNFRVDAKDKPRTPACFYERFSTLYFANRTDLIFKQIPRNENKH